MSLEFSSGLAIKKRFFDGYLWPTPTSHGFAFSPSVAFCSSQTERKNSFTQVKLADDVAKAYCRNL